MTTFREWLPLIALFVFGVGFFAGANVWLPALIVFAIAMLTYPN